MKCACDELCHSDGLSHHQQAAAVKLPLSQTRDSLNPPVLPSDQGDTQQSWKNKETQKMGLNLDNLAQLAAPSLSSHKLTSSTIFNKDEQNKGAQNFHLGTRYNLLPTRKFTALHMLCFRGTPR